MILSSKKLSIGQKRITAVDEIPIYAYESHKTDRWNKYRAKSSEYRAKTMLTVFFNYSGVAHYEFLPQD